MQNNLNAQFNSSKSLFLTESIKNLTLFFYEIPINVLLNLKIVFLLLENLNIQKKLADDLVNKTFSYTHQMYFLLKPIPFTLKQHI